MPDFFIRAVALDDIRIRSDGTGRTVEAYAAVFDQEAEIVDQEGHYKETNAPDAFNRSIERHRGVFPVVYHHGYTIAGTPSERGSVPIGVSTEVKADRHGVLTVSRYGRSELADEVLEAIHNGSITGQSYGGQFLRSSPRRPRGGWAPGSDGSLTVVRREVVAMREFGPTPFPAFTTASIVGVRAQLERLAAQLGVSSEPNGDAITPDGDSISSVGTPEGPARTIPLRVRVRAARIARGMEPANDRNEHAGR